MRSECHALGEQRNGEGSSFLGGNHVEEDDEMLKKDLVERAACAGKRYFTARNFEYFVNFVGRSFAKFRKFLPAKFRKFLPAKFFKIRSNKISQNFGEISTQ